MVKREHNATNLTLSNLFEKLASRIDVKINSHNSHKLNRIIVILSAFNFDSRQCCYWVKLIYINTRCHCCTFEPTGNIEIDTSEVILKGSHNFSIGFARNHVGLRPSSRRREASYRTRRYFTLLGSLLQQ